MRACTLSARAAPTDEKTNTTSETTITGLRPKLSEIAPWKAYMQPKERRYAESVCCISTGVARSATCMPAKAGR